MPYNKINNLPKIVELKPDQIIIDFEDSIQSSKVEIYINEFIDSSKNSKDFFVRVPLHNQFNELDTVYFDKLVKSGFTKFLLPKLANFDEINKILESLASEIDYKLILLIESVSLYFQLLTTPTNLLNSFYGIALGSHDLFNEIGMNHTLKNLETFRVNLMVLARNYKVKAIDVASMEISNEDLFRSELEDGYEKGFDVKLILHPFQLSVFKSYSFYNEADVLIAKQLSEDYDLTKIQEFEAVKINGKIIEKPQLRKYIKIIKQLKDKS